MRFLCDNEFLPAATNLVEAARRDIRISTFKAEMTTKPKGRRLTAFFDLLIARALSGVNVKFLISKSDNFGHVPVSNGYACKEMKMQGIDVRHLRQERLCHAKLIIADKLAVIVGSHNLSIGSCHKNFEVSCVISDIHEIERLCDFYDQLFEDAKRAPRLT